MPRHLISDAHEWINEVPTVPIYYLAKPQPRERAWAKWRGKKTLLSLTLVWLCEVTWEVQRKWESNRQWDTTTLIVVLLIWLVSNRTYVLLIALSISELGHWHYQVGSLAGAAHLLNNNTGVLRSAQQEQKSCVDDKAKSWFDLSFQYEDKLWKRGLAIL